MEQAALVERARRGDEEAFAALMQRHREPSLGFALSILHDHHAAEDAVKAILGGEADEVPEDTLLFVGALDEVTAS